MKTVRAIALEKRAYILTLLKSPQFALLSFGVFYALLWHFSIIYLSPFSWLDNRREVEHLFAFYLVLHFTLIMVVMTCGQTRIRSVGRFGLALVIGTYCLYLVIRALDWNVLYYYGNHLDPLFWENAFYSAGTGMMFTWVALMSWLAVSAVMAFVVFLMFRVIKHQNTLLSEGISLNSYQVRYAVFPVIVVAVVGWGGISAAFSPDGKSSVYTSYPPEYHFFKSIYEYARQSYIPEVVLSEVQKKKLADMGLRLETDSTEYPLYKRSVYFKDPANAVVSSDHPNVIVVIIEGLSSYFLDSPDMSDLGLTPNLHSFATQALLFNSIVNANTPTLQGQIAVLASSLHVFRTTMNKSRWAGHNDIDAQSSTMSGSVATRYPFLSRLLGPEGYRSVHIQGNDARFANTGHYFRLSAGYDEFISVADRRYDERKQYDNGTWGARDVDTFRQVTAWLESNNDSPFFMSISTMDIHHPYEPVLVKGGIDNALLNSVYSADAGFGVFWDYFNTSRYKNNTIVILTADHALFPTAEYLSVRGVNVGFYDEIPLMIYSPYHEAMMGTVDETHGSQLDIAPTLIELLGLDVENAFLGLSLLSDRKFYPYLLGKVNLQSQFRPESKIVWSSEEQNLFIDYIRYLASRNRLYPAPDKKQ